MEYLDKIKQKKSAQKEEFLKVKQASSTNVLYQEVRNLLKSLEKTGAKSLDKDFIKAVDKLSNIASKLESVKVTSDKDIKELLGTLSQVLSQMELRPVINVQPPKIVMPEHKMDFTPFMDKMKPAKQPLEYKAQDMDSISDPNIQWIGFIDAKGAWYIIENNTFDDSLRYKFGKKDYTKAWQERTKHAYKLYNEALNEI